MRLVPAGLLGLAIVFAAAGPTSAADLELKSRAKTVEAPAQQGFELAAARGRAVGMRGTPRGGGTRAVGRRAAPRAGAFRASPRVARPQARRPGALSARRPQLANRSLVNRNLNRNLGSRNIGNRNLNRNLGGRNIGNRAASPFNRTSAGRSRPGVGASLPTGERLAPADPHPRAGRDRDRRNNASGNRLPRPDARTDRGGRQQGRLPRPGERSSSPQEEASAPWPGYDRLPSGGRRVGPRPPEVGGSGLVNRPGVIESAIGAPSATAANLAAARGAMDRAYQHVQDLADENRRLRQERERVWLASQGSATLSPMEMAAVAEAGGFEKRWWQIQNDDLVRNTAEYDAAWQAYQDAQLAYDLLRGR
jgi:hypothetical protein